MNITNDQITEYIDGYYRPLNEELRQLRESGESQHVPIILKDTEMLLGSLLELKNPAKILEIGTAIGYSSSYFAAKLPDVRVYTIERDETLTQIARGNIASLGLEDRVRVLFGDGQEQTEKLRDEGITGFDMVFIDAAKSHYRRFLDAALDVCAEGALIVSDNVLQRGSTVSDEYDPSGKHKTNIKKMREYVEYIFSAEYLSTSLLSVGDGVAISIFRGD